MLRGPTENGPVTTRILSRVLEDGRSPNCQLFAKLKPIDDNLLDYVGCNPREAEMTTRYINCTQYMNDATHKCFYFKGMQEHDIFGAEIPLLGVSGRTTK